MSLRDFTIVVTCPHGHRFDAPLTLLLSAYTVNDPCPDAVVSKPEPKIPWRLRRQMKRDLRRL